jgi:hypothetical protein
MNSVNLQAKDYLQVFLKLTTISMIRFTPQDLAVIANVDHAFKYLLCKYLSSLAIPLRGYTNLWARM